jgi:hypothetical protein
MSDAAREYAERDVRSDAIRRRARRMYALPRAEIPTAKSRAAVVPVTPAAQINAIRCSVRPMRCACLHAEAVRAMRAAIRAFAGQVVPRNAMPGFVPRMRSAWRRAEEVRATWVALRVRPGVRLNATWLFARQISKAAPGTFSIRFRIR